ncbi:MAG: PEPxxWA-CTERM sorting domain-containing protein [Sphingomonadaceae bacterium]
MQLARSIARISTLFAAAALFAAPAAAATLVARYNFANTLESRIGGAPALTLVDPLGTSRFVRTELGGEDRAVLEFNGTRLTSEQGGLSFNSSGLLSSDSWSAAFTFQFFDGALQFRRIIDTTNRTKDGGLYVHGNNKLAIVSGAQGTSIVPNKTWHNIVLTVGAGGNVNAWLNGKHEISHTTDVLNISPTGIVNLFLDDSLYAREWSAGQIAGLSFYDGVLTPGQIAAINNNPLPTVPEPATWAMLIVGFGAIGLAARRRRPAVTA